MKTVVEIDLKQVQSDWEKACSASAFERTIAQLTQALNNPLASASMNQQLASGHADQIQALIQKTLLKSAPPSESDTLCTEVEALQQALNRLEMAIHQTVKPLNDLQQLTKPDKLNLTLVDFPALVTDLADSLVNESGFSIQQNLPEALESWVLVDRSRVLQVLWYTLSSGIPGTWTAQWANCPHPEEPQVQMLALHLCLESHTPIKDSPMKKKKEGGERENLCQNLMELHGGYYESVTEPLEGVTQSRLKIMLPLFVD